LEEMNLNNPVMSGDPQRSVLDLLLFLITVTRVPPSVGTELVLYADNMLLYMPRKIECSEDYTMLQLN